MSMSQIAKPLEKRLDWSRSLTQLSLLPFIGQQLMQPLSAVAHETTADILQIDTGIDLKRSASLDKREQRGRCSSAFDAAEKEPILAANGKRTNGPFRRIIVKTRRSMPSVVLQMGNQGTKIPQRFFECRFRQEASFDQPFLNTIDQTINDGHCLRQAQLESFLRRESPSVFFQSKELPDLFQYPNTKSGITHFGFIELTPDVCPARRPNTAMLTDIYFICAVFVRVDNPGIGTQNLFHMLMLAILFKIVETIWRVGALPSDHYPHVSLCNFRTVEDVDRTLINVDAFGG